MTIHTSKLTIHTSKQTYFATLVSSGLYRTAIREELYKTNELERGIRLLQAVAALSEDQRNKLLGWAAAIPRV